MPKAPRYSTISLILLVILGVGWYVLRDDAPEPPQTLKHSYTKALEQAHNGLPGAARVLYQQLARSDLSDVRRASLHAELPNYPSPQALKLADADLQHPSPLVRQAAIDSVVGLVPGPQRSLLLGPLLSDDDHRIRFAAAKAMLGLGPDELGLYYGPLQTVLDEYVRVLQAELDDGPAQLLLARLYLHDGAYPEALAALQRCLTLTPDDLDAVALQVQVLERQGQTDQSRQVLADQLIRHPDSAFLQHELGLWLLRHGQSEYALLAFARALELEPDNSQYRYTLATSLHDLEQVEAAQKQLEAILAQQPANRKARLLLISYWKETGQLQNVQVLLAQLEQQNPDDPILQQGL
ncbi:tetratricopeptide repeat protein [Pseudomonas sp. LS1212]|uniref:tetratricopeptide repeat protein n=1 Tax=Pseudomonas sp. LS1212 TaxID=2972478 RepID=UPI00215D458E|nr:tetratricopeptide repeat protein [Pseudomonas sp. LS1212]UVJ41856.1 tetratricopeptide repeat protein [Pseudomonas sp. LS1212]